MPPLALVPMDSVPPTTALEMLVQPFVEPPLVDKFPLINDTFILPSNDRSNLVILCLLYSSVPYHFFIDVNKVDF